MIPHERSLVKRMASRPFALIGINTDDSKEKYFEMAKKMEVTWRSSWQGSTSGPICQQYRVQGYPTLFLLDHEGVIREKWVGPPSNDALDAAVDGLVAAAEKSAGE
jgi:thioredoxin-related protein